MPGSAITVFPNPVTDVLTVAGLGILGTKNLTMTSVSGAIVFAQTFAENDQQINIPVSSLPSGIYFLHVATTNGIATFRVVK